MAIWVLLDVPMQVLVETTFHFGQIEQVKRMCILHTIASARQESIRQILRGPSWQIPVKCCFCRGLVGNESKRSEHFAFLNPMIVR